MALENFIGWLLGPTHLGKKRYTLCSSLAYLLAKPHKGGKENMKPKASPPCYRNALPACLPPFLPPPPGCNLGYICDKSVFKSRPKTTSLSTCGPRLSLVLLRQSLVT